MSFAERILTQNPIYENIPLSWRSFADSNRTAHRMKELVKPGENYLDRNPIKPLFIVGNYETADYILRNTKLFKRGKLQNTASSKLGYFVTEDNQQYENVKEVTRISEALVRKSFPAYDEAIIEETDRTLEHVKPDQVVDLRVLTLDIMTRVAPRTLANGNSLPPGLSSKMVEVMVGATDPTKWISVKYNRTVREVNQGLLNFVKASNYEGLGLISHFFKYLPEDQALKETVGMMVASIETTANTLARQFYEHAKNPRTFEWVREEALSTDLYGPRLSSSFKETARLYPIAWRSTRLSTEATVVDGIEIPEGCPTSTVPFIYLRDESKFINANDFVPQRFIDFPNLSNIGNHAWGAGTHACAGMALAQHEGPIIGKRIAEKFEGIQLANPDASDDPIYAASMQSPPLEVIFS